MGKIVGIDLGTTNSVIAFMEGGEPTVIPLAEGSRLCPSVVGFSKTGERLVGQLAKRQAITNPDHTIASIKRHMGTDYRVTIDDASYSSQEISAMILQKLKTDAEAFLGEKGAPLSLSPEGVIGPHETLFHPLVAAEEALQPRAERRSGASH